MDHTIHKAEFKKAVIYNLKMSYRKTIEDATPAQMYQAVSLAVKDMIIDRWIATHKEYEKQDAKVVYYMSMEFLTGRFLGNNIISLCEQEEIREALAEMGFDLNVIEDQEPDAALGQSRSRRRGVDSRGRPCGSFSIIAVSIQRFKSLHNKASKRIFFNSSRRACACAIPSCDKCPGMCPCRMWAAFSSVCPCLTR